MNTTSVIPSEPGTPAADSRMIVRHRMACLDAKIAVSCGRLVELCGWILGMVMVIYGAILLWKDLQHGVIVIVAGVIVLVVLRLLGAVGCSIGHMLRATLDTAVLSSPFLDEEQKKRAMDI